MEATSRTQLLRISRRWGLIGSLPCVGPLCSGGGGEILSITCISYLGYVNTSKPWKSYRDNPHVLEGQMGNPGHPGHRSGLSLKPGWACGREG